MRRQVLLNALKLFDLVLMAGCFLFTTFLTLPKSVMTFTEFLSMRIKLSNFFLFFVLLWLWHIVFWFFGLYKSRRMSERRADVIDTFNAATMGTLLITLAGVIFHIQMITVASCWYLGYRSPRRRSPTACSCVLFWNVLA